MSHRLTRPMMQVLQNLVSGYAANQGFPTADTQCGMPAILSSLRKRGYILDGRSGVQITPQGRNALTAAKRDLQ